MRHHLYPMLIGAFFIFYLVAMVAGCRSDEEFAHYGNPIPESAFDGTNFAPPQDTLPSPFNTPDSSLDSAAASYQTTLAGAKPEEKNSYYTMDYGFRLDYPSSWDMHEISEQELMLTGRKAVSGQDTDLTDKFFIRVNIIQWPKYGKFQTWYNDIAQEYDLNTEGPSGKVRYRWIYANTALKFELCFLPALLENFTESYKEASEQYKKEVYFQFENLLNSVIPDV